MIVENSMVLRIFIRNAKVVMTVLLPGTLSLDATHTTGNDCYRQIDIEAGCGIVVANKLPLAAEWAKAKNVL